MIPSTWGDVTPEWFTAVLAPRFPDAVVGSVTLAGRTDGTNRRARFELDYKAGTGPSVVFVKAEGDHREIHERNGNLWGEAEFYRSTLRVPVDRPEAYAVLIDRPALDWLAVLEDVTQRGADPRDATRPYTVEQTINGARALARMHAAFADAPLPDWVQPWQPTEGFASGLRRFTPLGLERAVGSLPDDVARLSAEQIVELWKRYVALLQHRPTLLHADAHIGNTYALPDGQVGFLDWAVIRRGNWSQDVGYFVQGALDVPERRAGEGEILDAYRAEHGHDLGADEAWLWYRASAAYGLAIWLSTLGTDGYQPFEISHALVVRYATAFTDLDSLDAISTLESSACSTPS